MSSSPNPYVTVRPIDVLVAPIIGDYRRVALYGVDRLLEAKREERAQIDDMWPTDEIIRMREELSEQMRALKDLASMAKLYDRDIAKPASNAEEAFGNAGGYAAEAEVRRIAAGLGLAADRLDLPIGALSGGERRRVELARILFAGDDLLLLDEPTNHLDVDAKEWLMTFLRTFRGALLVISHDLALLDQAITRILHLDDGELIEYRGTYSQYLVARQEDEARRAKLATRQESEIVRLKSLADVMRRQTQSRARTAKSLDTRVERMRREQVHAAKAERTLKVKLPDPPRAGKVVLEVEDLAKAFGPKVVFEDVTFDVGRGERLLVLGLNGGQDDAAVAGGRDGAGARNGALGRRSRWATTQEHEGIKAGRTVMEHVREQSNLADQFLPRLLGMFGLLAGDLVFRTRAPSPAARRLSSHSRCSSPARFTTSAAARNLSRPTTSSIPPCRVVAGARVARLEGRNGDRRATTRGRDRARAPDPCAPSAAKASSTRRDCDASSI
jgi:ATPase subunit of ABC transporter with duplicated ATPase domains